MYGHVCHTWINVIVPTFGHTYAFCVKPAQREIETKWVMKLIKSMVLSSLIPETQLHPCSEPSFIAPAHLGSQ